MGKVAGAIGSIGGAILGNTIAPGIGGTLGASLGGALGGSIGGGGGSSSLLGSNPGSVNTSSHTYPDWLQPQLQYQVDTARTLAEQPYTPYTGQRVAGLAPNEQQAINLAQGLSSGADLSYSQGINQQLVNRGLNGPDQATLNAYMNPYTTNVMDASRQRQLQQFDLAKRDLQQQQGATGAFGGSRSALAQGQLYDNFSQQLSENEANQLYQSYNDAQNRAFQGSQLAGNSAAQYGNQALQQYQSQQAGMQGLASAGALQRNISQQQNDVNYQDFLNQQNDPYTKLQYLQGIVNPIAGLSATSNSTTNQTGGPGLLQQGLGLGALAQGSGLFGGGSSSSISNSLSSFGNNLLYSNPQGLGGFGLENSTGYAPQSASTIQWGLKQGGQVPIMQHYAEGGVVGGLDSWLDSIKNLYSDDYYDQGNKALDQTTQSAAEPTIASGGEMSDLDKAMLRYQSTGGMAGTLSDVGRSLSSDNPIYKYLAGLNQNAAENIVNIYKQHPDAVNAALLLAPEIGAGVKGVGTLAKAGASYMPSLAPKAITAARYLGAYGLLKPDEVPQALAQNVAAANTSPVLANMSPEEASMTNDLFKHMTGGQPVKGGGAAPSGVNGLNLPMGNLAPNKAMLAPDVGSLASVGNSGTPIQRQQMPNQSKDGFNAPLVAFGAAMLGSKGDFYSALSEGANAYKVEKTTKDAAIAKAAQQSIKNTLDERKVAAYEKQTQGTPYKAAIQQLQMQIMQKKLASSNIGQTATKLLQADIASGAIRTPEQYQAAATRAMETATQMAGLDTGMQQLQDMSPPPTPPEGFFLPDNSSSPSE